MQGCIEHFWYQLPNEHTHDGYVLEAIETSDSTPLETMENIEEDTATTGKRNNYESDVAYLLPKYPVAKRFNDYNKRNKYHISDTSSEGQGFGSNFGIGKNCVHFIYHTNNVHDGFHTP